jgi:hypothetical protein
VAKFVDGNMSFCDICALSLIRSAWGKTLVLQGVVSCSTLFVFMEALMVIGAFYLEEINRLLVYVHLGDWNCSE